MLELNRAKYEVVVPEGGSHGFDQWKSAVVDAFPSLRISPTQRAAFAGSIRSAGAGGLYIARLESSPHLVERRAEAIASSDRDYLKISLHLSGQSMMIQGGREIILQPGDLTLYDTSRPYTMVQEEEFSMLVAMFPREAVRAVAPDAPELAGLKLNDGSGLASIVSGYLHTLEQNLDTLAGPAGARASRAGLELIGSLLATELASSSVEEPRIALLHRIQDYIDQHLGDPDLSPSTIAAAHFISVRYLHALFREDGKTVASWIRTCRLERCFEDLKDPLLAGRSVASIAARWGFLDPGHFSRLFRRAYGQSPTQFRESVGTRI